MHFQVGTTRVDEIKQTGEEAGNRFLFWSLTCLFLAPAVRLGVQERQSGIEIDQGYTSRRRGEMKEKKRSRFPLRAVPCRRSALFTGLSLFSLLKKKEPLQRKFLRPGDVGKLKATDLPLVVTTLQTPCVNVTPYESP